MKKLTVFCSVLLGMLFSVSSTIFAQGTVVVAGGGAEGDQGDQTSWSYLLYRKLIQNGDTNGDGIIKVAILTADAPGMPADDAWLPNYFQWIGTTLGVNVQAANYFVRSANDANSASVVGGVAGCDVVFIKGGDQGTYYDLWNGTLLEQNIRTVTNRNGAIGGTSAGAMSQAQYCFSGGKDMISADVLADAKTTMLDDASVPGTSGIHTDFLSFVPGVVIDTHYTQRARMGRMLGILGKAIQDFNNHNLYAIGIEQKTGLWIQSGIAEVIGNGSVDFIKENATTKLVRDAGKPLFYSGLTLDRLTHGWKYNLTTRTPVTSPLPAGVTTVTYAEGTTANAGALTIAGATETDKTKFEKVATYYPTDYSIAITSASTFIRNAIGFTDAGNSTNRLDKQETIYRALYDFPSNLGFLVYSGATVSRASDSANVVSFGGTLATLVIDCKTSNYKGLSPFTSNYATTGGTLKAAAFTNATVHVLAESGSRATYLNTVTHALTSSTGGTGGGGGTGSSITEIESNNSRSAPQDVTNAAFPLTITGQVGSSTDRDYFKFTLAAGQSVTINLTVPSTRDYDLYLLSTSGYVEARSTNNGKGISESITFTNTSSGTNTYFAEVEGYSGAFSTSANYTLVIAK
ncbi:MAG: pre-peptidase C-terminal domain-containing protein [Blastocatellia bacterium]|nr:pre-peptidase C-terminal domain-containing protein [Blastocatellia bacterium]